MREMWRPERRILGKILSIERIFKWQHVDWSQLGMDKTLAPKQRRLSSKGAGRFVILLYVALTAGGAIAGIILALRYRA